MKMSVRFRQFSSCCALTLLVLGVAASSVRADDDNSYKFKTPSPGEEPDYEFHPVKAANPHNVFLDYDFPRFSGYLMYSPSYFNLSQTLQFGSTLPQFSTSSFAPVGFTGKGDMEFSALWGMSLTLGYSSYSASAASFGLFSLSSSTASIFTAMVEPYYCFHPGASLLKMCFGPDIGLDSFPVVNFAQGSASSLVLTSYSDMVVGPHLKFTYPLATSVTGYLEGGADFGILKSGTSTGIHTNSHNIYWGEVGFETPISAKSQLILGFRAEDKSSNFQQVSTSGTFTWSATSTLYVLNVGIHTAF